MKSARVDNDDDDDGGGGVGGGGGDYHVNVVGSTAEHLRPQSAILTLMKMAITGVRGQCGGGVGGQRPLMQCHASHFSEMGSNKVHVSCYCVLLYFFLYLV